MPNIEIMNDDKQLVTQYQIPGYRCHYAGHTSFYEWNEGSIQDIKNLRKEFVHYQEVCRSEMKQLKGTNIELSKWLKGQIKEYVQWEKSATIFLKWMEPDIGPNPIKDWPVDYSDKLDYIANRYYLTSHYDLTFD